MKTHSIIHISDLRENKNQYKTANHQYYVLYFMDQTGKLVPCMITENDVLEGLDRAVRNVEDVAPISCSQYILSKTTNLCRRLKDKIFKFLA